MSDIICDCGHRSENHRYIAGCLDLGCDCLKSPALVNHVAHERENKKLRELSEFLFDQLWELATDGDDPDFKKIKEMVIELNFDMTKWPFAEL